jgi:6-phosphogluconolactonase
MLPIQEDGSLGAYSDQAKHEGSSVNERRQERAHAHCVVPSPDNRYAFVCDLGMDKIVAYKLDLENGEIPLNDVPYTETTPGAGPRHLTFHPNGRLVFVINELASTLTSYRYDADTGTLEHIQTVPGLPEDFEGSNTAADIHVSPSGKFLYGSMRGHDSIVVYAIDEETGELDYVEHKPSGGETPRNFAIDPTGTFLLAAHQDTNNIVVFRVEPDSGRLVETNNQVKVPMPVCIKMLPIS